MEGLMLHAGARKVAIDAVAKVNTPAPTNSWHPIPHIELIQLVFGALDAVGLHPASEEHSLQGHGDSKYFGLFDMVNGDEMGDHGLIVGLRNSHDKTFPAGLVCGSRVFVCDNLAFSGEVRIARKHTRFIERDLPQMVEVAVGRLNEVRGHQTERIAAYKGVEVTDAQVHDLVIRALDARVIGSQRVPDVVGEWRRPQFEDFTARTLWSLFNAFTYIMKDTNRADLTRRTIALHGLMDGAAGLLLPASTN